MYKNAQHYRYTVHRYLDGIWKVSSRKGKARSTMYSWLSTQMDLPEEETHVAKFTRNQCKQAIKILRPKYIELFGEGLSDRKENEMKSNIIKIKLRNNILVEELEYLGIEGLVGVDDLNNKYISTDNQEIINKILEKGLGIICK